MNIFENVPDGNYRYAAIDRQTSDFLLRLSDRAALLSHRAISAVQFGH
jgi:hypothetical protein